MKIAQIIREAVDIGPLIAQVSKVIPESIDAYVRQTIKNWEFGEKYKYEKEHRTPPDEWNPFDAITNTLVERVPINGNSPVYGAMTMVSKALTKVVQDYVRGKFGDPVILTYGKPVTVPVDQIKVSVWWHGKEDQNYGGVFRARHHTANGPTTKLEVIVDRDLWRQWLLDAFSDVMAGEGHLYDEFNQNIVNTFAHEYAHLEQSLKGQKNYTFSLLPHKKFGRDSSWVLADKPEMSPEELLYYYARPAEIDAFATGAAAELVDRITRNFQIDANRRGWGHVTTDKQWNDALRYEMQSGVNQLGGEYDRYISSINDQLASTDPITKAKYLELVKRRFLRTYYRRLTSYLRPITKNIT